MAVPVRKPVFASPDQAARAGAPIWAMKLVLALSRQCNTTASLRASATRAFLGPARLATANAQPQIGTFDRSRQDDIGRLVDAVRTLPSPIFEMGPHGAFSFFPRIMLWISRMLALSLPWFTGRLQTRSRTTQI